MYKYNYKMNFQLPRNSEKRTRRKCVWGIMGVVNVHK